MPDLAQRLRACFAAVFPTLTDQEVALASPARVAEWDSRATVTLVAVVEEEFGIEVAAEDFETFRSFDLILGYLGREHETSHAS